MQMGGDNLPVSINEVGGMLGTFGNVTPTIVNGENLDMPTFMRKGVSIQDIIEEVVGVYPKVMTEGKVDAGVWSCGMVAGLIHDIPTCKQLIDGIMADAEEIIRKRLDRLIG